MALICPFAIAFARLSIFGYVNIRQVKPLRIHGGIDVKTQHRVNLSVHIIIPICQHDSGGY